MSLWAQGLLLYALIGIVLVGRNARLWWRQDAMTFTNLKSEVAWALSQWQHGPILWVLVGVLCFVYEVLLWPRTLWQRMRSRRAVEVQSKP